MRIKNACSTPGDKAVQELPGQNPGNSPTGVARADAVPMGIAAQELEALAAVVPEADWAQDAVGGVQAVFPAAAPCQSLLGQLLGHGCSGSQGMLPVGNAAQAQRPVLPDDTCHPAAPHVTDAMGKRQVRMIGGMTRFVAVAPHDVRPEIGGSDRMINPNGKAAVVALQFFQGASGMGAGGGQIAVGMEAVNVAALNQHPDFLPALLIGIPI